ncbi:MAG: isochorismatase family protein [Candidatus Peribacteria bacterium]|jgi:nicotinamidase-related amidase|nr:isochorismatase family protein [Candidatus Peribacteria bacterium]
MQPLQVSDFDRRIPKGASPISAGYSGFEDTCLQEELESERKKILFLAGVATDYCVGQTALDAVDRGYKTYLISEAVRGVRLESTQAKLTELLERGVKIITINQLSDLLSKNFTC